MRGRRPMEDIERWLDELLADADLSSDFGRVRAHKKCVTFAEEHLAYDHRCNLFLLRAAERCGQPPMSIPVALNRTPLPPDALVCCYLSEEDTCVIVGNSSGLAYLSNLLGELSQALLAGEQAVLEEGYAPLVNDSYDLVLLYESEKWFDAFAEGTEDELAAEWEEEQESRIVTSEDLIAVQFSGLFPNRWDLTPQVLYRIHSLQPYRPSMTVPRKVYGSDPSRTRVIRITDDSGKPFDLAVDLDDPDLTFYYPWHLRQFGEH